MTSEITRVLLLQNGMTRRGKRPPFLLLVSPAAFRAIGREMGDLARKLDRNSPPIHFIVTDQIKISRTWVAVNGT